MIFAYFSRDLNCKKVLPLQLDNAVIYPTFPSAHNVYLSLFPSLSNADDNEFRSVLAFISREDGFERTKSRRFFPARN